MQKNRGSFQILVVEDSPGDFALIEDYLQEQIFAPFIRQAKTYKEAKFLLTAQEITFDVVLLDLSLPDKSGVELISEILNLSPNCPVIVLTGYSDISFGIKSLSLGVSDYLLKDELSSGPLYKSILYSIERRKTISALTESERRYSDLFHLSPLPMWVFDLETLYFLDVNDAAVKHYGYSREEFFGMTILEIRAEESSDKLNDALQKSKRQEQFFYRDTVMQKKKNGEIIYTDIQANTITFKGVRARLVLVNDITERIRYIGAIEEQNEKLKEIAWIQSHVVRAPLARMMGIVYLITELKTESAECESLLGHLLNSCNELDVIIRDIVDKSHKVNIQ